MHVLGYYYVTYYKEQQQCSPLTFDPTATR